MRTLALYVDQLDKDLVKDFERAAVCVAHAKLLFEMGECLPQDVADEEAIMQDLLQEIIAAVKSIDNHNLSKEI